MMGPVIINVQSQKKGTYNTNNNTPNCKTVPISKMQSGGEVGTMRGIEGMRD